MIEAMKEALEALKQCASTDNEMELKAIASLRQATAEAEKQEPVAWLEGETIYWHEDGGLNDWIRKNGTPLYTHPQPKREPLTNEQINELRQQYGVTSDGRGIKEFTKVRDFVRAIEAAHGIKE